MEAERISFAIGALLDYLDRRGPREAEAQELCRQLIPFVVRETGSTSTVELAARPARRGEIEDALRRLAAEGGTPGWLIGRLASEAPSLAARSTVAAAVAPIQQYGEGSGNVNQVVYGSSYGGIHVGLPQQAPPLAPPPQEPRPDRRESPAPRPEALAQDAWLESMPRPDLELRVREGVSEGRPSLMLELTARDPALRFDRRSFGPILLRSDPASFASAIYGQFGVGVPRPSSAELRALGLDLGRQVLAGGELSALLWRLQYRVTSLLLISDEPWIPWELIWLEDPAGGGSGRFLCEAFALARWLPGSIPSLELPLRRLAVVASAGGGAEAVAEERQFLERQQGVERSVSVIPSRFEPLLEALASGGYDGWHFCGHGREPRHSDPNLLEFPLDDHRCLTPKLLASEAAGLGRGRPLVFLNACHTGRGGFSLVSEGGWAKKFLGCGAAVFLGALWAIDGRRAAAFSEALYPRLFAGVPIAQAVRDARQAIVLADDPSWLAYTLYAHPLASRYGAGV